MYLWQGDNKMVLKGRVDKLTSTGLGKHPVWSTGCRGYSNEPVSSYRETSFSRSLFPEVIYLVWVCRTILMRCNYGFQRWDKVRQTSSGRAKLCGSPHVRLIASTSLFSWNDLVFAAGNITTSVSWDTCHSYRTTCKTSDDFLQKYKRNYPPVVSARSVNIDQLHTDGIRMKTKAWNTWEVQNIISGSILPYYPAQWNTSSSYGQRIRGLSTGYGGH
jgi:hypothetical protein